MTSSDLRKPSGVVNVSTSDPSTAEDTQVGAANNETELLPPAQTAPADAWSLCEDDEPTARRRGEAVRILAAAAASVALGGLAVFAVMHATAHPVAQATQRTVVVSAPPQAPSATAPDDDEFLAMAISPRALPTFSGGGYGAGTSGTQARADEIAMGMCRAHGFDDCLLVNSGAFHGCIALAVSGTTWASGSGSDAVSSESAALHRLHSSGTVAAVQCSAPPGILTTAPPLPGV